MASPPASWHESAPLEWLSDRQHRAGLGVFSLVFLSEILIGAHLSFHLDNCLAQFLIVVATQVLSITGLALSCWRKMRPSTYEALMAFLASMVSTLGSAAMLVATEVVEDEKIDAVALYVIAWKVLPLALRLRPVPSFASLLWSVAADGIALCFIPATGERVLYLGCASLGFAIAIIFCVIQCQIFTRMDYDTEQFLHVEKDVLQRLLAMAFDANFWLASDGDTVLASDGSFDDFMGQSMAGRRLSKFAAEGEACRLATTFSRDSLDSTCSGHTQLVHTSLVKSNGDIAAVDLYVVDRRCNLAKSLIGSEAWKSIIPIRRRHSSTSAPMSPTSTSSVESRPAYFVCFKIRPMMWSGTFHELASELPSPSPTDIAASRGFDFGEVESYGPGTPYALPESKLSGGSLGNPPLQFHTPGRTLATCPSSDELGAEPANGANEAKVTRRWPGQQPPPERSTLDDIHGLGLGVGDYQKVRVVGRGTQAVVWEVKVPGDTRTAAMKEINVHGKLFAHRIRSVDREIRILKQLQWARSVVVPIYEGWLSRAESKALIVMEFMPLTLSMVLSSYEENGQKCKVPKLRKWLVQMTSGIAAIHSIGAIHRDIKPANLLLSGDEQQCKIADLGISRVLGRDSVPQPDPSTAAAANWQRRFSQDTTTTASSLTIGLGTHGYISPEILSGWNYTYSVDMYSLGCVLVEILTLCRPWELEETDGKVFAPICRPTLTLDRVRKYFALTDCQDDFEAWVRSLCEQLLALEASSRPTAERVLLASHLQAEVKILFGQNPDLARLFKKGL